MATVYNTTFKLRRGTAAEWEAKNPVLATGEPGFIIDQFKLKIGDGATAFTELPFVNEIDMSNYITIEDIINGETVLPIATTTIRGAVLSSTEPNKISVDPADGSMEINSVSFNKIDTEGIIVTLDCGDANRLV